MSLKILLADDSMTAQNMGKKILTEGGYDVVTVSNGAAAIKKLAEFTPDLVIADVYMPGYNGLEICERIKKANATASVPVLLSVGKLEPFRPEEGLKVHADGIIIKPFEATDLLAVTAKLAERVGKAAPAPEVEPEPEVAAAAVEEDAVEEPVATQRAAAESASIPAFGLEEDAAAPAFAIDDKPDYVREFGLDPHDAPTTMFRVSSEHTRGAAAEPSFIGEVPEFAAPAAEGSPAAGAPASLHLAINDVALPEPEAPVVEEAPASQAEDDFEAKLAAAMAEYEPAAKADSAGVTDAVSDATVEAVHATETPQISAAAAAVGSMMPVAPSWVAEEAAVTEAEQSLSLEDELRAYAAAAGTAPVNVQTVAPAPIGDTSVDDEVSTVVEESKERFFPSAPADEFEATEDRVFSSLQVEPQDLVSNTEIELPSAEVALEPLSTESSLDTGEETLTASDAGEFTALAPDQLAEEQVFSAETDVPELMTHDVPVEWNVTPSWADATPTMETQSERPVVSEPAALNVPVEGVEEDFAIDHQDFDLPEAPFAHAAVDEPVSATVAHKTSEPVIAAVDHTREELVEQIQAEAPSLQESDIADAVARVMDRMKGDLISQIAKELAAKLGK